MKHNTLSTARVHARQGGASLPTMLVLLVVGGLLVTCFLKMAPVYLENWKFSTILSELEAEFTDSAVTDKREIHSKVEKRMHIDMIRSLNPKDVKITRDGDHYVVAGVYESRVELLGNVDVVMKFDNQVRLPVAR